MYQFEPLPNGKVGVWTIDRQFRGAYTWQEICELGLMLEDQDG